MARVAKPIDSLTTMTSWFRQNRAAAASFVALLALYSATAAPGVTFWDSGEFLAAIHSLGIPHPPGTPLYIIAANVWAQILAPAFGFARAVNLFSAVCAAFGCALLANLFARWMRDSYTGFGAAICAGATSTLWLSATEAEVYAPAFLVSAVLLWIGNAIEETGRRAHVILLAYVAGLGWALHLTALIALPAAVVIAAPGLRKTFRERNAAGLATGMATAAALGATVILFMYFRAGHDPAVNQGNPSSFAALSDVIARRQYGEMSLWPRQAPMFLQIGNLFLWADWQFALGLDPRQPPSVLRTPVTLIFAALGLIGAGQHRKAHRASWRAMTVLLVTASVGVALYLNLKAGPSYGIGMLAPGALHEVRERDYFFILVWVTWGTWAGVGAIGVARQLGRASSAALPLGLMVSAAPLIMNWAAVDRSRGARSNEATLFANEIFGQAPERAVVLARGDNDTYPVWYMREVEKMRPDILTVTLPMLPTRWYREELARRHGLLDAVSVRNWRGTEATLRVICERSAEQSRGVVGPLDLASRVLPPACPQSQ